jgi:S-(hydroxymethyl)glutathione dehydrogenase/alcohol dehydrogenase
MAPRANAPPIHPRRALRGNASASLAQTGAGAAQITRRKAMPTDIRAAVCNGVGTPLTIETLQLSGPGPGEVLIEIKASGLCHSDYHQMTGASTPYPFPIVLGHEGAGVVVECGKGVSGVKPGDHVIPLTIGECRQCVNCTSGKTNLCLEFFADMGAPSHFSRAGQPVAAYGNAGTFAQYVVMRDINVARIRPDVPFDIACYVGCGVTTGVGAVLYVARVEAGASVAVFGLGGIGLNVIQGARLAGATRIIGIDVNPRREAQARTFGATDFVNPQTVGGDLVDYLRELSGGGVDYSFECVGNVGLMRQALDCTRPGWGVSVVVGVAPDGQELNALPFNLLMGRTWKGAFMGNVKTRSQLPTLLDWYAQGRLNLDDLITHRLPLERINEGFELMRSGESVRTVVTF